MTHQLGLIGLNNMNKKILVIGGSGLLGKEIQKLDSNLFYPTHTELDITNVDSIRKGIEKYAPEIILLLAAYNKPPEHEKDPTKGLSVNIIGTANLCLVCFEKNIKLVYVSTDYVYTGSGPHKEDEVLLPPSRFAWSKLGGESAVQMLQNFLILRVDFGPNPFQWEKVYKDKYVSKVYVEDMAELVLKATKSSVTGVMNLGGPKVSLEEYARKTKPNIETTPRPEWVPEDTSMDITRMNKELL